MATKGLLRSEGEPPIFVWAQRDERARLVIDDDLRVTWSNDAARQVVEETGVFDWWQDRLSVRDRRWMGIFRAFIRLSGPRSSTLCLPHPSDDNLLCTAVDIGTEGSGHMTGLTLRSAACPVPLDGAALESAFHLTSAERRIVETLFAGRTAEEAGASLSVSVGTVRAHIRHIYEKVNVGSREAMFHKLLPYMSAW